MKNNEHGAGLLEILIMSGVLLAFVQLTMQSFSNFTTYQKYKTIQMSNLFLKSFVNDSVDCETTLSTLANSCYSGDNLEISSLSGDTLIKIGSEKDNSFSKIGEYQLRAICQECKQCSNDLKISVEARLVNKKNIVINHPVYKNKDWFPVYKKIPSKCLL